MIRPQILKGIAAGGCVVVLLVLLLGLQIFWPGRISVSVVGEQPADTTPPASIRVAILRSRETAGFLRMGDTYEAHALYWRDLLGRRGWNSDFVSDDQLEHKLDAYQVLVLPAVTCLSRRQMDAILAFVRKGNGVVATWATGTRNERGSWLGWQFLQELTGADAFEISALGPPWYLALGTANPLTIGSAAGSRAQIVSAERIAATALHVDAYWSDFRFFPADSKLPASYLGAMLHKQNSQGRVVWLGFHENSSAASGKELVDSVLLNSVAWTARKPRVMVDPWPAPYSSAILLALQLEDSPANANYTADMLLQNRVEGSFFALSEDPRQGRELLQTLGRAGEVGSHGRRAVPLDRMGRLQSADELLSSRRTLAKRSGHSVSGFAPVYGALPLADMPLLGLTGYRYFLAGGDGTSALPQMLDVSEQWGPIQRKRRLVRLTRWGDPDLTLSPLGLSGLDQGWVVERLSADAGAILSTGGLYILLYHTQGLSAPEYVPALAQVIARWEAQPIWIATGANIANWWSRRASVSAAVTTTPAGTLRLALDYRGTDTIHGLALTLYASSASSGLKVVPITRDVPVPNLRISPEDDSVHLVFNRLPAGSYAYELRQ